MHKELARQLARIAQEKEISQRDRDWIRAAAQVLDVEHGSLMADGR